MEIKSDAPPSPSKVINVEINSDAPPSPYSEENNSLLILLSYVSIYQGTRNMISPASSLIRTHFEKLNNLGVPIYTGDIRDNIFSLMNIASHFRPTSPTALKEDLKTAQLVQARNGKAFTSITPPVLSTEHSPSDILHYASKIPQLRLEFQSVDDERNINTSLGLLIAQLAGNRGEIILIEQEHSIPAIALWCIERHVRDPIFILTRLPPIAAIRPPEVRHSRRSRSPCRSRTSDRSCSSRSSRSTSTSMERPPSPLLRDPEGLDIVMVYILLSSMLFRGSLCRIGVLLCIVGLLC